MTTKPKLIVPKHVWDGAEKEKEKKELEKIPQPVGWRKSPRHLQSRECPEGPGSTSSHPTGLENHLSGNGPVITQNTTLNRLGYRAQ